MKKKIIVLILSLICLLPITVFAEANTLGGVREELKDLQNQKKTNDSKKALTASEKKKKQQDILNAQKQKEESENKIELAKKSIKETEAKIVEYEEKSKEAMEFYQLMLGNNEYLEFLTDASSITELIMRRDAIEQLVKYNQEQLVAMANLIKENEQKQVDLKNYEKELDKNIEIYAEKIEELDDELVSLTDVNATIDEQIALKKASIEMFESMKCKEDETLDACTQRTMKSGGWIKPVAKGRINSLFGRRTASAAVSGNHSGIDIGIDEGTTVYSATTSGVVMAILRKSSCGGNQVFVQANVGGKTYTVLYAHLLSISVKANQQVNANTVIGISGGYSTSYKHGGYDTCTTGAHLHLSVSNGAYDGYAKFKANLINPPGYPKTKGAYFYSRYQWFD